MPPSSSSVVPPWSGDIEPELRQFCKEKVYVPWQRILAARAGQEAIPPLLDFGPSVPVFLLPFVFHPLLIRLFLGAAPNMITLILNRAHNRLVFLAAERTEKGRYVEMIRLDTIFAPTFQEEICRMLQAGEEGKALFAIRSALKESGLERFEPGLLKIADLYFFEAFLRLSEEKQEPLSYLKASLGVAEEVIRKRLLSFYPDVPLERLLTFLRALLPPQAKAF